MSQAEELLNSMSEEVPVHTHPVPDTDTYFIIDPITRQIENTNRKKTVIMQYDHNSERFTFELPRYIDGHDMLECTSVTVNVDNIETGVEEPRVNSDAPDMTDLKVHPNDPEKVISSWLISRNSTQLAGVLSFSIEYKCVDSNGNVVYEWSTDNYDEIEIRARKKNGEAAVSEYTDVLEQWRASVFGAGDSVMANIAAEGKAQVAAVKAESETQQDAVELKGAQTLDSIPEDYTEVDAMADEAARSKGDAIVCETTGESVMIKDSSDDHIRGLKVFGKSSQFTTTGKNKLNLGQISERTVNGVALTPVYDDNGNLRYLNINGTATNTFLIHTVPFSIAAGTYKFTNFVDRTTEDGTLHAQICDSEGGILYPTDKGLGGTFTFETDSNLQYRIYIHEGRVANYEKIYPMLRDASIEDAAYEPYTGGKPSPSPEYPQEIVSVENPTVNVHRKNLLQNMYASDYITHNGITYADAGDGKLSVKGTATANSSFAFASFAANKRTPIPAGTYTVSGNPSGDVYFGFYLYDSQSASDHNQAISRIINGKSWTFTIDKDSYYGTYVHVPSGNTVDAIISPQLEVGSKATEYEPPSAKQSLSVSDRIVPGIPVTSGGNYTDSDGQQWVCDEVDLERGVYVQRIGVLRLEGSANWTTYTSAYGHYGFMIWHALNDTYSRSIGLCNQLPNVGSKSDNCVWVGVNDDCLYVLTKEWYDKGLDAWKAHLNEKTLEIAYVRNTPIETPLTAEEIAAFKALRTNHPNTTILNDAGAWMSVKYNADTKTYVENPKILKLTDSSTGLVYELKIVDGNLTVVQV